MARDNQVVGFKQNADGTQVYTIAGQSRTFDPSRAALAVQTRAMYHGFKQRISDKAALSRDPKTGRSATPEAKRAAVWAIIDHYESGTVDWELPRTGGGGRSEASYILEAAAQVQDVDQKTMAERVATMAEKRGITVDAYLRKLAATSEAVREAIARIKYGEAEGGDDMLDELGEGAGTEDGEDGEQT